MMNLMDLGDMNSDSYLFCVDFDKMGHAKICPLIYQIILYNSKTATYN